MQFQFRKLFAAGTAAVMLLSGMTFFPTTASAEGTMTADDITENMTIGWNIGNSLDSTGYSGETSWGNPRVTQELRSATSSLILPTESECHNDY